MRFMQTFVFSLSTMAAFMEFCPKSIWNKVPKSKKSGDNPVDNFYSWHNKSAFFLILYFLVPKSEICIKYFLNRYFQKHCFDN